MDGWREAPPALRVAAVFAPAWVVTRAVLLSRIVLLYGFPLEIIGPIFGALILLTLYGAGFWQVLVKRSRAGNILLVVVAGLQVLGSLGSVAPYRVSIGEEGLFANPGFVASSLGLVAHVVILALVAHPKSWAHTAPAPRAPVPP